MPAAEAVIIVDSSTTRMPVSGPPVMGPFPIELQAKEQAAAAPRLTLHLGSVAELAGYFFVLLSSVISVPSLNGE